MAAFMKRKFKEQRPKFIDRSPKPKTEDRRPKTEDRQANSAIQSSQSAILFGVLPVLEALRAENRRIEKIFVADGAKENVFLIFWIWRREEACSFKKSRVKTFRAMSKTAQIIKAS